MMGNALEMEGRRRMRDFVISDSPPPPPLYSTNYKVGQLHTGGEHCSA